MASNGLARARIAHQSPGRIRLSVERPARTEEIARRIEQALAGIAGVRQVEARPASRSVVLYYSPLEVEVQRIVDEGLPKAGVDLVEMGVKAVASAASGTRVGRVVVGAVGGANSRLERATGGILDLRDLFPLTLFGLGLRRVAQGNLQPVPWYNLLYYGYSTFAALHGRRGGAPAEPDAVEILRRRYARGEISGEELRRMLAELAAAGGADRGEAGAAPRPAEAPRATGEAASRPRRPRRPVEPTE